MEFRDSWPEMRVRHLEILQRVITRMADRSASLKNYCLTLSAAVLGLTAVSQAKAAVIALALLICIFAALDAAYLRNERAFRRAYDKTRSARLDVEPDFEIKPLYTNFDYIKSVMSWSVVGFYGPVVMLSLLLANGIG